MKLSINTSSYNQRRYGKPYVGKLSAADGKVTSWGTWIGTAGCSGILEIDVAPGDVIIEGQKDNRGNHGTPNYGVVLSDGTIEYMGKAEAIKAARAFAAQVASQSPAQEQTQTLEAALVGALRDSIAGTLALTQEEQPEADKQYFRGNLDALDMLAHKLAGSGLVDRKAFLEAVGCTA